MKKIKGFTMIELLIVIAVLGILAVAVLSAINPLEQIRRGRDTGSTSDCEQLISAIDRRYAVLAMFPWQESEGEDVIEGASDTGWTQCGGTLGSANCVEWIQTLVDEEEVKTGFQTRVVNTTANPIFLYYDDEQPGASIYACYEPQSSAMAADAGIDCVDKRGGVDFPAADACAAGCETDIGDATPCFKCLP